MSIEESNTNAKVPLTLRIRADIHEILRRKSFNERKSINALVEESLERCLASERR